MARTQIIGRAAPFLISMTLLTALAGRGAEAADLGDLLLSSAMSGNAAQVESLLRQGADADTRDQRGATALICAAAYGHTDIAEMLVGAGADVNARGPIGNTALIIAAQEGHGDIASLLIDGGADVAARNNYGGTAISLATGWGHRDIATRLSDAAQQKNDDALDQMVFALAIGLIGIVATPMLALGALKRAATLAPRQVGLAAAQGFAHKL